MLSNYRFFIAVSLALVTAIDATTTNETESSDIHEHHIKQLYKNISGFGIASQEAKKINDAGGADTYGEITYGAAKQLFNDLNINHNDVFFDLGSGVGKMVIQAFLTTPAKKCVGIELSPTRCRAAESVKAKLKNNPKFKKRIQALQFLNQDILKSDLRDATIIYMCSTCYPEKLMKALTELFAQLPNNVRVITLKKLPEHTKFKLLKEYALPMTWSKSVPVYVYALKR